MTRTRFVITSLVLLCLIAFIRNVHAQDAKMDKRDMHAVSHGAA